VGEGRAPPDGAVLCDGRARALGRGKGCKGIAQRRWMDPSRLRESVQATSERSQSGNRKRYAKRGSAKPGSAKRESTKRESAKRGSAKRERTRLLWLRRRSKHEHSGAARGHRATASAVGAGEGLSGRGLKWERA
jgi:hypothetical protein